MGCCIQSREDPNNKDKSNLLVDVKGKISNNFINKYGFTGNNSNQNTNKTETKIDNVKNYFKSPQNNASNSNMENSFNNTVTIENSNLINTNQNSNNNNAGQDLFKTHKKVTNNLNNDIQTLNIEKEQKDKENNEMNEKMKVSENITITNNDGLEKDKIIKFPKVEFLISNSKNPNEKSVCVITPNSINNEVKKMGEKFYFGKDDPKAMKKNHFNFNDDSIGVRQFEIAYNSDKGKFFLVDNKRGTGLFIKIRQRICVDHDMIVSFCASHMILQLEGDKDDRRGRKIKIRFLQGPHQNQDWTFNPSEKKIIRIGRSKSAEIVYKDDSISRIQCTLVFDAQTNNWFLYDGYLENGNKGSTNGLWLLASSKVEVVNDMTLKTGNTTIRVVLTEK